MYVHMFYSESNLQNQQRFYYYQMIVPFFWVYD